MALRTLGLLLLIISCFTLQALCLQIHLSIKDDTRPAFYIQNFGFEAGGVEELTLTKWKHTPKIVGPVGFLVTRTDTDASAFLEDHPGIRCLLSESLIDPSRGDFIFAVPANATLPLRFSRVIQPGQEGLYNLFFINCAGGAVSFHLDLVQYNIDPSGSRNYLSIGEEPLGKIYIFMALVYTGIVAYWIWLLLQKDNRVLRIHWLMAGLAVLKIASLIFHAIDYHQLARNGHPGAWAVVYYIFAFLKGVMLFIVILLIGTGWSLIKPYLSEEDKKIFMIVLPLQVLDNIALIVVEEMAPGSQGWFTWKDIFRLVDIICCGAILIPIIWSIRHLREAAVSDGKAARSIEKLQQFRRFYLLVIAYIYFTRIIVILLDAVVPFRQTWLGEFSSELATLAFYCITGYMFRPATNNPYLRLEEEEESRTVALQELTSGQDL